MPFGFKIGPIARDNFRRAVKELHKSAGWATPWSIKKEMDKHPILNHVTYLQVCELCYFYLDPMPFPFEGHVSLSTLK